MQLLAYALNQQEQRLPHAAEAYQVASVERQDCICLTPAHLRLTAQLACSAAWVQGTCFAPFPPIHPKRSTLTGPPHNHSPPHRQQHSSPLTVPHHSSPPLTTPHHPLPDLTTPQRPLNSRTQHGIPAIA
ncbi:hypothetical protein ABBQ32_14184 [Trebouxia sp. C0010 RCD-2024]